MDFDAELHFLKKKPTAIDQLNCFISNTILHYFINTLTQYSYVFQFELI